MIRKRDAYIAVLMGEVAGGIIGLAIAWLWWGGV